MGLAYPLVNPVGLNVGPTLPGVTTARAAGLPVAPGRPGGDGLALPAAVTQVKTWATKSDFVSDGGQVQLATGIDRYDTDNSLKLLSLADTFDDNELNPERWTVTAGYSAFSEVSGWLEHPYDTSARAIEAGAAGLSLTGDFDIQIDYGLIAQASGANPRLSFVVNCANNNYAWLQFASNDPITGFPGYQIESWFTSGVQRVDTNQNITGAGVLRVARQGTVWTLSYKLSGQSSFTTLNTLNESTAGLGAFGSCTTRLLAVHYSGSSNQYPVKSFQGYFDNLVANKNNGNSSWAYTSSGTWRTEVDGGAAYKMVWQSLEWELGSKPSGTSAIFQVRGCTGANGGGTCGSWYAQSLSPGGTFSLNPASLGYYRYLQIQVDLGSNSNNSATPQIDQLRLEYEADTTAPSAPVVSAQSSIQSDQCQATDADPYFTWPVPSDNLSGVKRYWVYWGSSQTGSPSIATTNTYYQAPSAAPSEQPYYFRIRAEDNAGNLSAITTFTVKYDVTPPSITGLVAHTGPNLSDPLIDHDVWQNQTNRPTFRWNTTDGCGTFQQYRAWSTNSSAEPATLQSGASFTPSTSQVVADGEPRHFRLKAIDEAGNTSLVSIFTVKYDSIRPDNPPPPATVPSGTPSDTWQNSDNNPYFNWSAGSDAHSGVAGYQVYWGTDETGTNPGGSLRTSQNYDPTSVSAGTHYLRLRTKDNAGNYSLDWQTMFIFRYDNLAPPNPSPVTDLNGAQNGVWQNVTHNPNFTWTHSIDAHSGVAGYQVYWGDEMTGTNPGGSLRPDPGYDAASLGEGTHYLRLRTQDNAGNWAGWTTGFIFQVDQTEPVISNLLPVEGTVFTDTARPLISADLSDPLPGSGVDPSQTEIRLNGVLQTPITATTSGVSYRPAGDLPPGVYTLRVRVEDEAGNWAEQEQQFTLDIDVNPPTLENLSLTLLNPPLVERLHLTGTEVYYGPAATGTVRVSVRARDDQTPYEDGLDQLYFPPVFGLDGAVLDLRAAGVGPTTEQTQYTVVASQTLTGTYPITVTDVVGHQSLPVSFRVEKDTTPPSLTNLTLAAGGGDPGYRYLSPALTSTLYYQPQASGQLTVSVTIADSQAGLGRVTFPDLFTTSDGDDSTQPGQKGPEVFSNTHPLIGSTALSQSFAVSATDKVDNIGSSAPFTLIQDSLAPTPTFTIPERVPMIFDVVWGVTDLANASGTPGAGIRHFEVQYRLGITGTWTDLLTRTTETHTPFKGDIDQVYYFRIQATDNVSNTGVWVEAGPVMVSPVTKYYTHGGTRVAMRQGDEVYYLHGDHLGSTSLTTDSAGDVVSEVRYLPYGQERWTNEVASPTDFGFTSQRAEKGFGLYDYNARYYSPYLGRFISPDSIVPEPGSSSGFNRYRYARNNPLKYTDPSGHCGVAVIDTTVCIIGGIALGPIIAPVAGALLIGGTGALILASADKIAQDLNTPEASLPSYDNPWTETFDLEDPARPTISGTPPLNNTIGSTVGSNVETFPLGDVNPGLSTETPNTIGLEFPNILEAKTRTPGIYEFPDLGNPGKTYVGQSNDIDRRLSQHEKSGKYAPGSATTTPMSGSTKFEREIAEQNRINALGGIGGGNLSNQRNPIGPAREEEALKRGLNPVP